MSRGRWGKVEEVKARLIASLERGRHEPGSRYLSTRALASRFEVSPQTADRLIQELCREGWLERRPSSGTFVSEGLWRGSGALLCFHSRARRPLSFGSRLLSLVVEGLKEAGVPYVLSWDGEEGWGHEGWYPILWEASPWVMDRAAEKGRGLVLNDLPSGWRLDSVSVDDFAGGVRAGEMVRKALGQTEGASPGGPSGLRDLGRDAGSLVSVLGGPREDRRSQERISGFLSVFPEASVVEAGWFLREGLAGARKVLHHRPSAVFCANDRLAEAVLRVARQKGQEPSFLVGFDDAPIAAKLGFSTIAIPWEELATHAVGLAKRRMTDREGAAVRMRVLPQPVDRGRAENGFVLE